MPHQRFLLVFLFFVSCIGFADAQAFPIRLAGDSLPEVCALPLAGRVTWSGGISPDIPFEEAVRLPFFPFEKDSIPLDGDHAVWFHFSIQNTSSSDSLRLFLCFREMVQTAFLFQKMPDRGWRKTRNGTYTDFADRAFPPNKHCFPIALPALATGEFYLRLFNCPDTGADVADLHLATPAREKMERTANEASRTEFMTFHCFFQGILWIIIVFTLITGITFRDKSYGWYALYLLFLSLFYLRTLESGNKPVLLFAYVNSWHLHIEPALSFAIYAAYGMFVRSFLNIGRADGVLNAGTFWGIRFFLCLLALDPVLQLTLGLRNSFRIFEIGMLVSYGFAFALLFLIWKKGKTPLGWFIIIGNALLLLNTLPTVILHLGGGYVESWGWYALRTYHDTWLGTFTVPSVLVGIIVEVLFFLAGLAFKTRLERLKFRQLEEKWAQQEVNVGRVQNPADVFTDVFTPKKNGSELPAELGMPEKPESLNGRKVSNEFISKVTEAIEKHFANEAFNVDELARQLPMNRSAFSRKVKELSGMEPSELIRRRRLEHALALLRQTGLPVSDVAFGSGFASAGAFSKAFREHFGVSPREARKSHLATNG